VSAIASIRHLAGHAIARTLDASTSTQGRRSNTTLQPRRKSIIQDGISAFTNASKHGQVLSFTTPPKPRVLDYLRTFAPLAKVDIMQ
jgi:hypothetical protein